MSTTREPVLSAAVLSSAIAAVIALVVAFGLDVTPDQTAAILGVVATVFPIVAGLLSRSSVTPVASPLDASGAPLVPVSGTGRRVARDGATESDI